MSHFHGICGRAIVGRKFTDVAAYRATVAWEDGYYSLVRPHKSLRLPVADGSLRKWLPRTRAMAAKLTDHIWIVKELLTMLPVPDVNNA